MSGFWKKNNMQIKALSSGEGWVGQSMLIKSVSKLN